MLCLCVAVHQRTWAAKSVIGLISSCLIISLSLSDYGQQQLGLTHIAARLSVFVQVQLPQHTKNHQIISRCVVQQPSGNIKGQSVTRSRIAPRGRSLGLWEMGHVHLLDKNHGKRIGNMYIGEKRKASSTYPLILRTRSVKEDFTYTGLLRT